MIKDAGFSLCVHLSLAGSPLDGPGVSDSYGGCASLFRFSGRDTISPCDWLAVKEKVNFPRNSSFMAHWLELGHMPITEPVPGSLGEMTSSKVEQIWGSNQCAITGSHFQT